MASAIPRDKRAQGTTLFANFCTKWYKIFIDWRQTGRHLGDALVSLFKTKTKSEPLL